MKPVKVRKKITWRYLLRLIGEGLGYLFLYIIKYLPWIGLMALYFFMMTYQSFRTVYCEDLEHQPMHVLSDEEVQYMDEKCEYKGEFIFANVEVMRNYVGTGFKFSLVLTAIVVSLIPLGITRLYLKETFPPKTITMTILVFIFWFLFTWLVSSIIIYDPFYDLLKDFIA